MLIQEILQDDPTLKVSYSDSGYYIKQIDTGILYQQAIDLISENKSYEETSEKFHPIYESEIEYLQATGEQYIITNITYVKNINVKVEMELLETNATGNNMAVLGATNQKNDGTGQDGEKFIIWIITDKNNKVCKFDYGRGKSEVATGKNLDTYITYSITKQGPTNIVDGVFLSTNNIVKENLTSNLVFYIMAMNKSNTASSKFTGRIYSVKFYTDTLIADFIPVRICETGYLYDKISGKLYGNNGTGRFILGPDKEME